VRCSELAAALGEELVGTAPYAPRWQIVVDERPWGRDAVGDAGLAKGCDAKPLLVRGALSPGRAFLVCTNGARDPCCALLGAAVVRALGARAVACSHLGGHRFAANVLVLPDNLLFGRVDAESAGVIADELDAGRLPLDQLRGRCDLEPEQQAAEILLRRELDLFGVDDVTHRERTTFATPLGVFHVHVDGDRLPPRRVSCRDAKEESPTRWRLTAIAPPP